MRVTQPMHPAIAPLQLRQALVHRVMLSSVYQKVMGSPIVYNTIRPFLLGGLDLSPFYHRLEAGPDAVILDVGCGTGNALDYLDDFSKYSGFDTDPIAIRSAKQRFSFDKVEFHDAECKKEDVIEINPSLVILCGVLHHLPDDYAIKLMRTLSGQSRFQRLFTLDISYLPGVRHLVSNALASFDRGRHCRTPDAYRELVSQAGLTLKSDTLLWNHPERHIARYHIMTIEKCAD